MHKATHKKDNKYTDILGMVVKNVRYHSHSQDRNISQEEDNFKSLSFELNWEDLSELDLAFPSHGEKLSSKEGDSILICSINFSNFANNCKIKNGKENKIGLSSMAGS